MPHPDGLLTHRSRSAASGRWAEVEPRPQRRTTGWRLGVGALAVSLASAVIACQSTTPVEPGDPGPADVTFTIRSDQATHPISPLIYGINDIDHQAFTGQTASRLGGNRWTAYDWETNASNAGSDYCYENDDYLGSAATPAGPVLSRLAAAQASGTALIATVPIVDHLAGDTAGGSAPPGCSGDIRKSANYLTTRLKANQATAGTPTSATPVTTDATVTQDQFVYALHQAYPNANVLFSLDNEPDLWSSTHPEVHPAAVTYSELATRAVAYAKAIKAVWPTAPVLGPVSYGWYGFTALQGATDSAAKGDFLNWWLDQMQAADAAAGHRLVDYLDLHWYPEATGGGVRIDTPDSFGAATVAARVQAPRSLWDPSYVETSWISQDAGVGAIDLIPRMQAKIAAHDRGSKLSISEWNYGGGSNRAGGADVSGAVATADVLGVFGQQGLDLATYWAEAPHEEFNMAAFKAFRNYDGHGAAFGPTSELATSSDVPTATVYASRDASGKVVIVAVNKATTAKTAAVKIADPTTFTGAAVYRITAATADVVAAPAVATVATNALKLTLPPMSVTVLVPHS